MLGREKSVVQATQTINQVAEGTLSFKVADKKFRELKKGLSTLDFLGKVWPRHRSRLLKKGNTKLDKSIAIWSIPAVFTCLNHSDCVKKCYAIRSQLRYPSVRKGRVLRFLLSKHFRKAFKSGIVDEIKRRNISTVRIHESGDFYNKNYVNDWKFIARASPGIHFYYYTKMPKLTKILAMEPNVNQVNSILPDGSLNFGPRKEILEVSKKTGFPVCPVTSSLAKGIKCGRECNICQHKSNILFVVH